MFKVLFVATGNICRSPAEGVFQHLVSDAGLPTRSTRTQRNRLLACRRPARSAFDRDRSGPRH